MSNLSDLIPAGGGQNNTDFVADGTIASGKPVILTSAGKAAPIAVSAADPVGVGTAVAFDTSASTVWPQATFESTNNKIGIG